MASTNVLLTLIKRHRVKRKFRKYLYEKYGSVSQILQIKSHNYTQCAKVENRIKFKSRLEFGASYKDVIRLLGKPLVKYSNPKSSGHKILMYNYILESNAIKCEVHLYNNKFFMGVYTSDSLMNDTFFLKEFFLRRYVKDEVPLSTKSLHVLDDDHNSIYLNEMLDLEMCYLSRNAQHLITR